MADPIADLHMVLTTCVVSVEATHTLIINNKSLTSIADFNFYMVPTMTLPRCRHLWRIV